MRVLFIVKINMKDPNLIKKIHRTETNLLNYIQSSNSPTVTEHYESLYYSAITEFLATN